MIGKERAFHALLMLSWTIPASPAAIAADPDPARHARELAHRYIIVDGHVDVPIRHYREDADVGGRLEVGEFDHPRAVEGGLDAPFMSIFTPASLQSKPGESKAFALRLIDYVQAIAARHPSKFMLASSVAHVRGAKEAGKIALLMGMENGSPIEDDVENVDLFRRKGISYITLTHSKDNAICDSSYDDTRTWKGLSPFGREVVARMNDVGIVVDVSHVSDDTFFQVMELSRAPVFASHSSARKFTPGFERNMSDEMIRLLAEKDGVIMVNFGSSFLDGEFRERSDAARERERELARESGLEAGSPELRAWIRKHRAENPLEVVDVSVVADHIDHVVSLVGVDHVGFGSDFDGVGPTLPRGLEDVSRYPNLIRLLIERGYSDDDIEKMCSGNVLRVMSAVERIAAETGAGGG
ncbi:MAG: dipeptidase [Planctomycetota bacterium JB042]